MTPFPWAEAIGFGLGVLRLPPAAFWRMTPRELAFAIAAVRGPQPGACSRATLSALMTQFPDTPRQAEDAPHG
ncbi:MAG: phage tail assembly chaperone [Xanthobacteraceae bacterium]|nr:MAG: phage tail assembly chaperone [Xanthobacteraceae bacterium]